MKFDIQRISLAIASAGLLTLYGCGGGSSSTATAPPPSSVATTADVGITVIDGPIKNATVCLDKNNNGACDTGEPTGKTDVAGKVTLKVDLADVGKYAVLAVVGTDAVDSDTGAVPVPFTLKAPADKTGVVSPLTTLVQSIIESTGVSSAVAASQVQAQTGINVSLFEDFTKSTSTDNQAAGTIARMLVVTTQQQSSLLGSSVGGSAIDGALITKADLDKIIQNKLLEILPALLTALADPAVLAATTTAAKEAALLAQANTLVSTTGLTTASVATLVAINNQTAATTTAAADVPAAGASLRLLNFTNASTWSSRINVATLAQATPDSAGLTRSVQRRYSTNNGFTAAWTTIGGNPARQSDLHFNGTAWVGCALNSEDLSTVRDAKGNAAFNTCDNYETGTSNRASFDISGKTMLEVYNQINAAGYTNVTISNSSSVLGSTTFPANSRLFYQAATVASTAVAYYAGTGNTVSQYSAAVYTGSSVGCNSTEFSFGSVGTTTTSLEGMVTANPGTPCDFGTRTFTYNGLPYTSDGADKAWGNSTLEIGKIGNAFTTFSSTGATAPGFYSGNTRIRVAFNGTGINPVTYYSCKERFFNPSPRNCTVMGTGSYTIATKGDARIMTLSNPPLAANVLGYQRVFVERNGKVYFGYQNNQGVFNSARLNLPATNALFTKLGLPSVSVDTPLTLTQTSYAGEWRLPEPGNPAAYSSIFIGNNGSTTVSFTDTVNSANNEASRAISLTFNNLATGSFTGADTSNGSSIAGTFNFMTGAATVTVSEGSPPVTTTLTGTRN